MKKQEWKLAASFTLISVGVPVSCASVTLVLRWYHGRFSPHLATYLNLNPGTVLTVGFRNSSRNLFDINAGFVFRHMIAQ